MYVYLPCLSSTQRNWNEATMRQRFGSLFGSSMRMRLRLWLGNRKWHEELTWNSPRERDRKWQRNGGKDREREWWQHSTPSANASAVVYLLLFKLIISSQAGGELRGGAGQGSQSDSVSSVPIRSLFHKQSRLPRRSFNKVCRRLGIKISCELDLIFYLFVFALWLSVFCSPPLASPSSRLTSLPFSCPLFALVFVAGYF